MKPSKVKSPMRSELAALVTKLGGEDDLFSILDDFYLRMSNDTMIGFFFEGRPVQHIAHMQGKFLLNAAGLIPAFEGKGPSTAHVALPPILSGHFDRRLVILRETLISRKLSDHEIDTWVRFEESFRSIVVSD